MAAALVLGNHLSLGAPPSTPKPSADAPAAIAQSTTKPEAALPTRTVAFEKYRLPNGLTVILHEDRSLPLIAINIWYDVGPVNEPTGRSGFAHLFEHLMFEGSKYVGPNFDRLLEGVGATNSNGTTSWDRTNYFETVPSQYLELLLWIESDRMGFLRETITQERLDVQRDVVKNERRQSYENAPYGPSALALLDTAFPEGHPYHGAIIGSMKDLSAATLADVHDFAERYYAPSNATLCLAGDFETPAAKALIEKYFGSLRKIPKPKEIAPPNLPKPTATRVVVDEPVGVAKVAFAWVAPPAYQEGHAALTVLSSLLADGKATRLYRRLVVDERVAVDVDAEVDANELSSLFSIDALATQGTTVETLEARLAAALEQIVTSPPTDAEMKRAKRRIELENASDLELLNGPGGESGRAGSLQRFNHYLNDPNGIAAWQARLARVTSDDVVRAVKAYLDPNHRITVITRPKAPAEKQP
jgi:zinc protease